MNRRNTVLAPLAIFLFPGLGGCSSCEKDKPYVPYTIDPNGTATLGASSSAPEGAIDPPPPETSKERFTPVVAKRMKGAKSAKTAAGAIAAPGGSSFDLLLEGDVTADGKPDALAWMKSADGTGGELVQFGAAREGGPLEPRTLVPLPADLTLQPGCKAATDLRQVGPHTVALSFRRTCSDKETEVVTEWKAVVVPVRDPAVRLDVLIDQPSGAEQLALELDGLDRDGDQFDDLLASVRLTGSIKSFDEPDTGDIAVSLHYFDRPAGLSRDPHEPSNSFAALARRLDRDADGSNRSAVWPAARETRRIHRMLCAEAGHPRVRIGGAPLQCGATDALHRIATAELDATLGAGALVSAMGAFDRLQAEGASAKDTDAARKQLEKSAPRRDVDSYHLPFGPGPADTASWGSLAFAGDGALLIRSDSSVMRFDPKSRVALPDPASGPVPPWGIRVEAPGGAAVLEGVKDPCDGGLLQAQLRRAGTTVTVPLPLDPLTTRGCSGNEPRTVGVRPVAWTDQGLAMVVAGTSLWLQTDGSKVKRQPPSAAGAPMGGPASPDGKSVALASSLGVLVVGEQGKGQLWRSASMASGYERLTACTVSNGATAVACVDGSRTRVFVPGTP